MLGLEKKIYQDLSADDLRSRLKLIADFMNPTGSHEEPGEFKEQVHPCELELRVRNIETQFEVVKLQVNSLKQEPQRHKICCDEIEILKKENEQLKADYKKFTDSFIYFSRDKSVSVKDN